MQAFHLPQLEQNKSRGITWNPNITLQSNNAPDGSECTGRVFFYSQNMIKTYVFIQPLNLLHANVISHSHTYTDLHTSCLSPLTLNCSLPIGRGLHGNLPITCNVAFPFYFQSSPKGITNRRSFIQSAIVFFLNQLSVFLPPHDLYWQCGIGYCCLLKIIGSQHESFTLS